MCAGFPAVLETSGSARDLAAFVLPETGVLRGTEDPAQPYALLFHLYPCEPAEPAGSVSGTAEAVLRLVYGRNQATDDIRTTGTVTLTDLRSLSPGF